MRRLIHPGIYKKPETKQISWADTFNILRDVVSGCRRYMSSDERDIAMFVFERTCMFGKERESIPLRHFTDGIMSSDGDPLSAPVAMSRTNLLMALNHLERKGILKITKDATRASIYQIARFDELDLDAIAEYMMQHQPKVFMAINGRLYSRELAVKRVMGVVKKSNARITVRRQAANS